MANRKREKSAAASNRSPFVVVLIVASVIAMGVVGYAVSSNVGGNEMAVRPVDIEGLNDPVRLGELAQSVVLGNPDAPIKIIEFADYQCPSCRYFQEAIKPRIDLAYLQDGIAQFVFYDFPLAMHPHAFLAARAARCAGDQDGYWPYHDKLFASQPQWAISAGPPARLFVDYAAQLGLDRTAFENCLRSDRHAEVVTANQRLAMELGMPGTPAIMIQGPEGPPRRLEWDRLETLFETIAASVDALRAGS